MAILRAIAVVGVLVICAIPSGSMAQQTRSQGAIEKLGNWLTSDITESLARFMRALNEGDISISTVVRATDRALSRIDTVSSRITIGAGVTFANPSPFPGSCCE